VGFAEHTSRSRVGVHNLADIVGLLML